MSPAFPNVPKMAKRLIYLTIPIGLSYGYLLTVIAAYLPEIGMSGEQVGAILAATGVSVVIVAIPLGIMSDRIGRKKILMAGLLLIIPMTLVYGLTTNFTALFIMAFVGGVGEGAFMASWNALIADMTTTRNREEAFVLSFIMNGTFTAIGAALPVILPFASSLLGISILQAHQDTFLILTIINLIPPLVLNRILKGFVESREQLDGIKRGANMGRILRFSFCNALIGLGAGLIIPLIPTWLWLEYQVPDSLSGPLLAVAGISIAMAAFLSVRLGRRVGAVRAIVACQGMSTIFMVLIPLMPGALLASIMYLVRAMLMNMAGPLGDAYMMGIISKEERGLASAINNIVWRLPNSVTTVIGGAMLAAGIYDLPFYLAA
ncbi:MAG TPA: MFS transporter, partial [Methanomassiliicoccales archaeon]|nr:MFS transporter [Methanomassiliicoccales archaeon]